MFLIKSYAQIFITRIATNYFKEMRTKTQHPTPTTMKTMIIQCLKVCKGYIKLDTKQAENTKSSER